MVQTPDLSQNFRLPLNTEPVNFIKKTAEGTWADPVRVPNAKRRAITKDDLINATSQLTQRATVWHIWRSQLPDGVEPKIDDRLADHPDGPVPGQATWLIKSIGVQSLGTRFRCVCTLMKSIP